MKAGDLIARSVAYGEIAHAPYGDNLAAELSALSDDSVEANDGVCEFWGRDEDGQDWRVHLSMARGNP